MGLARALLDEGESRVFRGFFFPMKHARKSSAKRIVRRNLRSTGERRQLQVAVRVWEKKERMRP
jgi:hypothetical protein